MSLQVCHVSLQRNPSGIWSYLEWGLSLGDTGVAGWEEEENKNCRYRIQQRRLATGLLLDCTAVTCSATLTRLTCEDRETWTPGTRHPCHRFCFLNRTTLSSLFAPLFLCLYVSLTHAHTRARVILSFLPSCYPFVPSLIPCVVFSVFLCLVDVLPWVVFTCSPLFIFKWTNVSSPLER